MVSALAAGCPVILKPSEHAPSSAQIIVECFVKAGLPDGALQLVHGAGDVGAAITGDPRVKIVSFTGGPNAGRAIARAAAEDFKVLQLELGGNNPALVLDDADIDVAADGILDGMTKLNGQWCEGPGKVLAHKSLVEPLLEALLDRISRIEVGHSLDENTELGPISNAPHFATLQSRIDGLRANGATIHQPAKLPELDGFFLSPTSRRESTRRRRPPSCSGRSSRCTPWSPTRTPCAWPTPTRRVSTRTCSAPTWTAPSRSARGCCRARCASTVPKIADLADGSAQSFWGTVGNRRSRPR